MHSRMHTFQHGSPPRPPLNHSSSANAARDGQSSHVPPNKMSDIQSELLDETYVTPAVPVETNKNTTTSKAARLPASKLLPLTTELAPGHVLLLSKSRKKREEWSILFINDSLLGSIVRPKATQNFALPIKVARNSQSNRFLRHFDHHPSAWAPATYLSPKFLSILLLTQTIPICRRELWWFLWISLQNTQNIQDRSLRDGQGKSDASLPFVVGFARVKESDKRERMQLSCCQTLAGIQDDCRNMFPTDQVSSTSDGNTTWKRDQKNAMRSCARSRAMSMWRHH